LDTTNTTMAGSAAGILLLGKKKSRWKAEQVELEAAFRAADVDKDGKVSIQEYVTILKRRGIYTNKEEVEKIFAIADRNSDSGLSRSEFQEEMSQLSKSDTAFMVLDSDQNGAISLPELRNSTKLSTKQARQVLARSDSDGDKVLNRREFQKMMNKGRIRNPGVPNGERAFQALDKNKDGFVSTKELAEGTDVSLETATIGIRRVDRDNDGKLNKKEFNHLMTSKQKK